MRKALVCLAAVAGLALAGTGNASDFAATDTNEHLAPAEPGHEVPDEMRDAVPVISQMISLMVDVPGYAGVWTNYTEGPTIVVGGTQPNLLRSAVEEIALPENVSSRFVAVPASLEELLAEQELLSKAVSSLDGFSGSAVREHIGAIDVELKSEADAEEVRKALSGLSERNPAISVRTIAVPGAGDQPSVNFWGGGLVGGGGANRTSGFTMRRTTSPSWRGLVAAGHSPSTAIQSGVTLGAGFHNSCTPALYADKQYYTIPSGHTATNRINISVWPYYRDITAWESSPYYFWNGRPIEKQGRNTGYETGTIETSWYETDVCGPNALRRVRATAQNAIGDSGGPVFSGNEALGIISGTSVNGWVVFSRSSYIDYNGYVPCTAPNCTG